MSEGAGLEYRYYVNGFPKSGLHLITSMLRPVARPMPARGLFEKPWAGTFNGNSWTDDWLDLHRVTYKAGRLMPGCFLKAHAGYKPELERFLFYLGVAHVFIYRDPRDVAVSQVYHIFSDDDEHNAHPDKDLYREMGFDNALAAVITGIDDYPGVMDRWELYAPWLAVEWTHKVRFEDALAKPHKTARALLEYGFGRAAEIFECQANFDAGAVDLAVETMVDASRQTDLSPTFRRGQTGEWRKTFTERHRALFKESDQHGWLVRLGYAKGDDW